MEKKLLATLALTLLSGAALAAGSGYSGSSSSDTASRAGSASTSTDASTRPGSASASTDASAFDRLDTNKDGTLSRSEFDVHVQEMARMKHGSRAHSGKRERMSGSESGVRGSVENDTSASDPGKAAPKKNANRLGIPEGSRMEGSQADDIGTGNKSMDSSSMGNSSSNDAADSGSSAPKQNEDRLGVPEGSR